MSAAVVVFWAAVGVVSDIAGLAVGLAVGPAVGGVDGGVVGLTVGVTVPAVGEMDGNTVGLKVVPAVGRTVGGVVGLDVFGAMVVVAAAVTSLAAVVSVAAEALFVPPPLPQFPVEKALSKYPSIAVGLYLVSLESQFPGSAMAVSSSALVPQCSASCL